MIAATRFPAHPIAAQGPSLHRCLTCLTDKNRLPPAISSKSLQITCASLLIDAGIAVEQVADLLGDDPRTLYRYYRHRVRPVVDAAAAPMEALFGAVPG